MNLVELKEKLKSATDLFKQTQREKEKIISEELLLVDELIQFLKPSLPTENINNQEAILIYVFEDSNKKTISNKVYYCEDKRIRYQVFKKEEYKNYNPLVEYEGSYAIVTREKMFETINLQDVLEFFIERLDVLPTLATRIKAENKERAKMNQRIKEILED